MIYKKNSKYLIYIGIISFILVIVFLSVGYSAFQNRLAIENIGAIVRIDKDIRITNVSIEKVNNVISNYEEYNVSNFEGSVILNASDSYVIYDVEISNLGNIAMGISDVKLNNDNLKFEFLNYKLKDKICENGECSLGIKKNIRIKVSYKDGITPSGKEEKFLLSFVFGRFFNISYFNITNSNELPSEIIEGDTLNLSISDNEDHLLKIFMNNKLLNKDVDYTHINNNLIIKNISGDLQINLNMPICQRATLLHTEKCLGNYCSGMGYKPNGLMGSSTITYGKLGTSGVLSSGDAFDCDVNGDGIYDSVTERFYYVTDMENNNNIAVLIYYNNVSNGMPSNDKYYQYYNLSENWNGPITAMEQLPTTAMWSNVKLSNSQRKLVNEYGTTSSKDGHKYPEVLDYSKYSARLLTIAEVKKLVDIYIPSWKNGEFDSHLYLVENTNFSKKDNSKFDGYWLENPRNSLSKSNHGWIIYATARRLHSVEVQRTDILIGVRPVIEVSKNDILY